LFFFALPSLLLAVVLLTLIVGAAGCGLLLGRSLCEKKESVSEPFGVLQAALLGFMALILAFGLSLAIGRYDTRRQAVVPTPMPSGPRTCVRRPWPSLSAAGRWRCSCATPTWSCVCLTSCPAALPPAARLPRDRCCNGNCGAWPRRHCSNNL
jgi:hypothetical protein